MKRPAVLVFAGVDPSGGAGMVADVQAIAALGAHALAVVTVLTVQDNDRVHALHPVAAELVRQQADALTGKIAIAAVKIGVVGDLANALAIAAVVAGLRRRQPSLPVVLDPVLASGRGDALAAGDAVRNLAPLLALATVLTPNLPEAAALEPGAVRRGGDARRSHDDTESAAGPDAAGSAAQAAALLARGCAHVLLKGGHGAPGLPVRNTWFAAGATRSWDWPRLPGAFHGSGCTLAAALAACLARGMGMAQALDTAQAYCQRALENAYAVADGQRMPDRFIALEEMA